MTYYVERVLACSRKKQATASLATPAAKRATAHAVALCTARSLHAAGDRRSPSRSSSRGRRRGSKARRPRPSGPCVGRWPRCTRTPSGDGGVLRGVARRCCGGSATGVHSGRPRLPAHGRRARAVVHGAVGPGSRAADLRHDAALRPVLAETQLTQARHYSAAQMRACATAAWDRNGPSRSSGTPGPAVSAYDHLVNVSYSA